MRESCSETGEAVGAVVPFRSLWQPVSTHSTASQWPELEAVIHQKELFGRSSAYHSGSPRSRHRKSVYREKMG